MSAPTDLLGACARFQSLDAWAQAANAANNTRTATHTDEEMDANTEAWWASLGDIARQTPNSREELAAKAKVAAAGLRRVHEGVLGKDWYSRLDVATRAAVDTLRKIGREV